MPKILVIDDKQDNLISIKALLQNLIPDCRVFTAQSGEEGFAIAVKEQPDTILLDIIMPEMDGYTVCKKLKESESTKHIPVVMLTAIRTDTESRIKGLEAGADAFFSKPIDPAELSAQVNVMLRIKSAEDKLRAEKQNLEKTVWERTKNYIKSENKYRLLIDGVLETSAVGIFILDSDFKVVWINRAMEEYFGLKRAAVIGKDGRQLIRSEIKNIFAEPEIFAKRVLATYDNNTYKENFECHVLPEGDRKERWLEHWSQPIESGMYHGGRIEHYSDITERKLAEQALRESEYKARSILNALLSAIILLDRNGTVLDHNRAYSALYGAPDEKLMGKFAWDLFPAEKAERWRAEVAKVFDTGKPCLYEDEYHGGWYAYRIEPVFATKGDRVEFVVVELLDITERKCAEEEIKEKSAELEKQLAVSEKQRISSLILYKDLNIATKKLKEEIAERRRAEKVLRENEKKFRALIESSFDGILINDKDGNYLYANRRAAEISGYTIEELLQLNVKDLTPTRNVAEVMARILNRFKGEPEPDYFESQLLCKSGKETPVEVTAARTVWQGKSAEIITMRDISERRQLEQQLLQAQKMESVGTLAGGVAHDFNNLLTIIQGNAQMLQMAMGDNNPHSRGLKQIINAATKAANLTRQLLLFSRKQTMEFKPVDLNDLLTNLLKMLQRLLGEDIEVQTHLQSELRSVNADEGNIEQVIMNICVNARDAMPNGGKLTITTENVRLNRSDCKKIPESSTGDFVRLMIEDTGEGISQDKIGKIFEPFYTTKEAGRGTGLGLAVVYGIVKKHNGWINVYSEEGQGTVFKIYLPAGGSKAVKNTSQTFSVDSFYGNGERILIIEDNDDVRKLSLSTLHQHGYITFDAADPREARNIFKQEDGNFNLILSDVVLPEINGLELVRELLSGQQDIPVIMCSGYTKERVRQSKINGREVGFLQKPYKVQELLKLVKETITENRKT